MEGLPADYLARHQPDADGQITLSTDQPDMQPVMTFAASAALRERMFLAYNTRAYPANKTLLEQLLATRQQIANVLGFRSWADLATADQMMESAANVRTFLAKLDQASREGAVREHKLILDFARGRQPGLKDIDIASRGYWYEQFRRSAFDFDSQSVRPYFPYAKVEAGVLETAARLFKIEFRPSATHGWDPAVSVSRSSMAASSQAVSISTCIRAKARTSGFPLPPWSPGYAAATCPRPRSSATSPAVKRAIRASCNTTTWSLFSTSSAT